MKTPRRSSMARLMIVTAAVGLALVVTQMPSSTASAASTALSNDEASFNSSTAKKAASSGTKTKGNNGVGNGPDCLPPGLEKNGKGGTLDNDDNGGTPGNPQNQGGNH